MPQLHWELGHSIKTIIMGELSLGKLYGHDSTVNVLLLCTTDILDAVYISILLRRTNNFHNAISSLLIYDDDDLCSNIFSKINIMHTSQN